MGLFKTKTKQMTSIEWLIEEMLSKGFFKESVTLTNIDHLQYKAEEMHKQEIIKTFDESENYYYQYLINHKPKIDSETYYQETFVSKGSDAKDVVLGYKTSLDAQMLDSQLPQTTSDKWKEYQDWLNEPPEISDEEIEKGAKEWYNKEGAYSASAIALKTWVYAIRWYREQLKQK